jgi:hypothetical protein
MGSAPSRPSVAHVHVCQLVCGCGRQPSFAGPLSATYSSRRSAFLGSRALDSRTGGGRTRSHTSGTLGSRVDSRRITESRATGLSGRQTTTQHGDRTTGHSGRRSSSHHRSRRTSHGGGQGGRTSGAARDPRLSGIGTNPQQRARAQGVGGRLSTIQEIQRRSRRSGW